MMATLLKKKSSRFLFRKESKDEDHREGPSRSSTPQAQHKEEGRQRNSTSTVWPVVGDSVEHLTSNDSRSSNQRHGSEYQPFPRSESPWPVGCHGLYELSQADELPPPLPAPRKGVVYGKTVPVTLPDDRFLQPGELIPLVDFLREQPPEPPKLPTRKDKLAWKAKQVKALIENPKADPQFAFLPKGANNRIRSDKDPLPDKWRRRNATPTPKKLEIPAIFQEPKRVPQAPLERPAKIPSLADRPASPRFCPPIIPAKKFETGPARDEWGAPFGGEIASFHEAPEEREKRIEISDRERARRKASDKYLSLQGQRQINDPIIGRPPPLSERILSQPLRLTSAGETKLKGHLAEKEAKEAKEALPSSKVHLASKAQAIKIPSALDKKPLPTLRGIAQLSPSAPVQSDLESLQTRRKSTRNFSVSSSSPPLPDGTRPLRIVEKSAQKVSMSSSKTPGLRVNQWYRTLDPSRRAVSASNPDQPLGTAGPSRRIASAAKNGQSFKTPGSSRKTACPVRPTHPRNNTSQPTPTLPNSSSSGRLRRATEPSAKATSTPSAEHAMKPNEPAASHYIPSRATEPLTQAAFAPFEAPSLKSIGRAAFYFIASGDKSPKETVKKSAQPVRSAAIDPLLPKKGERYHKWDQALLANKKPVVILSTPLLPDHSPPKPPIPKSELWIPPESLNTTPISLNSPSHFSIAKAESLLRPVKPELWIPPKSLNTSPIPLNISSPFSVSDFPAQLRPAKGLMHERLQALSPLQLNTENPLNISGVQFQLKAAKRLLPEWKKAVVNREPASEPKESDSDSDYSDSLPTEDERRTVGARQTNSQHFARFYQDQVDQAHEEISRLSESSERPEFNFPEPAEGSQSPFDNADDERRKIWDDAANTLTSRSDYRDSFTMAKLAEALPHLSGKPSLSPELSDTPRRVGGGEHLQGTGVERPQGVGVGQSPRVVTGGGQVIGQAISSNQYYSWQPPSDVVPSGDGSSQVLRPNPLNAGGIRPHRLSQHHRPGPSRQGHQDEQTSRTGPSRQGNRDDMNQHGLSRQENHDDFNRSGISRQSSLDDMNQRGLSRQENYDDFNRRDDMNQPGPSRHQFNDDEEGYYSRHALPQAEGLPQGPMRIAGSRLYSPVQPLRQGQATTSATAYQVYSPPTILPTSGTATPRQYGQTRIFSPSNPPQLPRRPLSALPIPPPVPPPEPAPKKLKSKKSWKSLKPSFLESSLAVLEVHIANMDNLQVRQSDFSSVKTKAVEDARQMQATVIEVASKAGKDPPKYALLELIGKGSFGRVYKGKDMTSAAIVAVKIIDIDESDTLNPRLADSYSEFLKEVNALKILSESNARNINHVIEALPVGQSMWMITEHCGGGSIATLMKPTAPGGLQEKWIIPILREVAEAIKWVHQAGIIHRDIKCANVLITEDGGLQLCDFGVAGIIENKLDKRSTVIGTPHWMAPELFDATPSYGKEVDIWAFGSMVYEIATGLPPNVANGISFERLGTHLKQHVPRLEGGNYSNDLRNLVAYCLEELPSSRPTIEQVQRHPYIYNTSSKYPASSLSALVRAFKMWEDHGGSRKSLFMLGGAQGPSGSSASATDDEWNFSTTAAFDQELLRKSTPEDVFEAYGNGVALPGFFSEETSRPQKPSRRRPPPEALARLPAPLEKIFDPNTMSNYEDNSRNHYGRAMQQPASDLPLRDDTAQTSIRDTMIDLGGHDSDTGLSNFPDMDTIKANKRGVREEAEDEYANTLHDFSRPALSDPADINTNRRTQDWKFPSMAPPASADPELSRFPTSYDLPRPTVTAGSAGRPTLVHHSTEPIGAPFAGSLLNTQQATVDRLSMRESLIDLDMSMPDDVPSFVPSFARPSTANSDTGSATSEQMTSGNPFELERHASLYAPLSSEPTEITEPEYYITEESAVPARLRSSSVRDIGEISDFSASDAESSHDPSIDGKYDTYSDSDMPPPPLPAQAPFPRPTNQLYTFADFPELPAPPSEKALSGTATHDEMKDEFNRMLSSMTSQLEAFRDVYSAPQVVQRKGPTPQRRDRKDGSAGAPAGASNSG